ncbi:MAG TPA: hypothetical protein VN088_19130 [Nocardioides sp.]|nr:hypothetical protein [Nocardioides sp.]
MSWIGDHVTKLEAWAKDLIGHADEKVHEIGQEITAFAEQLKADAPKLADEAESAAAEVAHTAETQGLVPAEREAVADGETLIVDAGHDVAAAVEGSAKSEPAPAVDPKTVTAVIAAEAVASEPTT